MAAEHASGRFVWYELMTSDPDAAKRFYTGVIGWDAQAWEGMGTPYTVWLNSDRPIGGLMKMPAEVAAGGAPPHWLGYVGVSDVDAAVAHALKLGGKICVPPRDIPNTGRFAVLTDPQGAAFAVYKSASGTSEPIPDPKVGDFSWHELATTDYKAALEFYSNLFGWVEQQAMDMGEHGIYLLYGIKDGPMLGGMYNKPKEMPAPPHWLYYASVDDINKAAAKVKEAGGQILFGPHEVPGGDSIVMGMDPQMGAFALHAKKK